MVNQHEKGNSAGESAGRARRRAPVPANLSSPAFLIAVFLVSAALAAACEVIRSLLFTTTTIRQSHELTVGFIALSSTAVFYFISQRKQVDEALREGEETYSVLFESLQECVMMLAPPTWRFAAVNPAAVRLFGAKDGGELLSAEPWTLSPEFQPDAEPSRVKGRRMIDIAMEKGSHSFEWTHKRMNGDEFLANVALTRIVHHGQTVLEVTVRDITERKRAEAATNRLAAAVEQAGEGVVITDVKGAIRYVNPAFSRMTGYGADEVYGRNPRFLKSGQQDPAYYEALWQTIGSGRVWQGELINRRRDGTLYTEEMTIAPVRDPSGAVTNFVAVKRDATERKRVEEELYQSRQVLQSVLDSIPQRVFWKDRDSSFLGCNQAFARDAGLKDPADIVGKNDSDLPSKESAESYRADDRAVMDQDSPKLDFEERMERPGGDLAWLRTNKMPLHNRDGEVIGVLGTYEDITGRKLAEEAVRQSEEKYRSLVSNIPEVAWTADSNLNFTFISESIERLSGFPIEEVYSQGARLFLECIHPDDIGRVKEAFEALFRAGAPYDVECRIRRKNGDWIWIHDRALGTYDKDGVRYADGLLSDITERKQTEEALRESEEEFRSLVSNIPDVTWTVDSGFHFVYISKNVEKIAGYTDEEIYRKGARFLVEVIHPDDVARTKASIEALLTRGEPYQDELRVRRKDGEWVWVHNRAVAAYEKDGVRYADGLLSDITARKRAELELQKSERQVRSILENMQDAYIQSDIESQIQLVSPSAPVLFGYDSVEEMMAVPAGSLYFDQHTRQEWLEELRVSGRISDRVGQGRKKDGSAFWVSMSMHFVYSDTGRVVGYEAIVRDISARMQAEEALRESEARLKEIFASVPTGIMVIDPDNHRIVDANPEALQAIGLPLESVVGEECHKFICPADRGDCPVTDLCQRVNQSERVLLTASGEKRSIVKTVVPIFINGRKHLLESFVDITERKRAEETRALLASIVETSEDAIIAHTLDGKIASWNRGAELVLGYRPDEAIGQSTSMIIAPEQRERWREGLTALARGESLSNIEGTGLRKDGQRVEVSVSISPILDAAGRVTGSAAIFRDITARKRADEARAFLASIVESSSDAIVGKTLDGTVVSWNRGAELLYGYPADEVIGKSVSLLAPLGRGSEIQQILERVKAGETISNFETSRTRKDGAAVDVSLTVSPIRNAAGEITGAATIAHDITERKRDQEALQASEEQFRQLAENIREVFFVSTPEPVRVTYVSPVYEEIWGRPRRDVYERPAAWMECIHEEDRDRAAAVFARSQSGEATDVEYRIVRPDGSARWIRNRTFPITDGDGRFYRVVGTAEDITERKIAEEQMRLLTTALESAASGVTITDRRGRILWVNPAFTRLTGYSSAEVVGQNPRLLKSGAQDSAFYHGMWDTILAGAVWQGELVNRRKDGSLYTEEMTITPVRGAVKAVSHFIAIRSDVSERKRGEQALRESEERYRELFENASDLVYTTDLEGRITSINRAAVQTTGYSADEATRMTWQQVVDARHWERAKRSYARLLAGERTATYEADIATKDGRRVMLEVMPRLVYKDGEPVAMQGIARDVTGRNAAEMELRHAQKLESVGRLASGIAHEINTPIQFVGDNTRFLQDSFGGLETLLKKYRDLREAAAGGAVAPELIEEVSRTEKESDCEYLLEEIPKALSQTLDGVNRVATIVRAMKDFAHPDGTEKAAADINKALLSTLTVARNELKYVADVETQLGDLPPVVCNIGDLNQVFLNLLVNAAHAIAEKVDKTGTKGQIRVRTAREDGSAVITIADTGCGIPEANRARVFDPFFTTKEVGRGTGQGLAIARSVVVERHKGTLTFESEVGKGTTFYIRLPLSPVECGKDAGAV